MSSAVMLRRIVVTLVIMGFIATQWVALPHAHGEHTGDVSSCHSSTPHVHLSWFSKAGKIHRHTHGGHRHAGHDHATCDHRHDDPDQPAPDSLQPMERHDGDAVYVETSTLSMDSAGRCDKLSLHALAIDAMFTFVAVGGDLEIAKPVGWRCEPETRAPICALYLRLRTLRI